MTNPIIALLGNPNVGKTSLFNRITKLHQKVGNYPGITVEKREGSLKANGKTYTIVDLPGTYTLFPTSLDEEIVFNTLADKNNKYYPDLVVVVAEPNNLTRSIISYQQARELGLQAIFVINMIDEISAKGLDIDYNKLESFLRCKIYTTDARNGKGIKELISAFDDRPGAYIGDFTVDPAYTAPIQEAKALFPLLTEYHTWQYLVQDKVSFLSKEQNDSIFKIRERYNLSANNLQKHEVLIRHKSVEEQTAGFINKVENQHLNKTNAIDKFLLHPIIG